MVNEQPPLVARDIRRVRIYRAFENSFWLFIVIILLLNVLRWVLPSQSHYIVGYLWAPFGFLMVIGAIPWFVIGCAFMFGLIKCPICREPFTAGLPWYVKSKCAHCGVDLKDQSVAASN